MLGNLDVSVAREVRQLQYLQLFLRKRFQGLAHLPLLGVAPGLSEGLAGLGRRCGSLDLVLHPAAARAGADLVDAAVADYGEDPAPDAAASHPVATGRAPNLDERFLDHVFGLLLLAHHPVRQRVSHTAVAVVEGGEGLSVAYLDEAHQVLFRVKQVLSAPIRHAPILLAAELERFYVSATETAIPALGAPNGQRKGPRFRRTPAPL